ncbi:hypothetical protein KP509_25G040600 [Ceratopteris richardii]|nr:hypothetical protein KP509_25G040600 [Ceratopteris richardii]
MHRKLGSFEFSVKKLKHLISTVYKKNALKLVESLHASNQEVDMQELLLDMTFRSICEVVFGNIFNAESDSEVGLGSVAVALDNAQEMILRRYLCPWWKINRFLNIGSERVFREDMKQFNNFLTDKIERKTLQLQKEGTKMSNTVECQNSDCSPAQDLLSRFLWSQQQAHPQDAVTSNNNNQEMIRDAMTSFVLAGRDTTASTLSWFIYCMCIYPEKQEKIFNELVKLECVTIKGYGKDDGIEGAVSSNVEDGARVPDEVGPKRFERKTYMMKECEVKMLAFARMFADEVLTYEHLQSNRLPYLHSAITETLRLYPAVPRDGKIALKADILPDGTHLNAGDQVVYVPYAMGRMSFLWGPDALDFRPERWLHDGCFQPQSPFKFSAFQAGPRMCLGKDAAYLQMKLTAALLIRFFRFQMVPNHPVKYRMMNVLTMKHGLRVYVAPREINQEIRVFALL